MNRSGRSFRRSATALLLTITLAPGWSQSPVPSDVLMREGIRLHGQRDFDGAARMYRKVLEAEPTNVTALYELSFSLSAKGDCGAAVDTASRGLAATSAPLDQARFLLTIGGCRDRLGDPQAAVHAFKTALELQPTNYLAQYNLGVTYARMGQLAMARESFEHAVTIEPRHASSHNGLSRILQAEGQNAASLLALLRFLSLEPAGARAAAERTRIDSLFAADVRKDNAGKLQVVVNSKTLKSSPVMAALELGMGIAETNFQTRRAAGADVAELRAEKIETVVKIAAEIGEKEKDGGSSGAQYLPFFVTLNGKGLGKPFAYYVQLSGNEPSVPAWLASHAAEVDALRRWLQEAGPRVSMPVQN